MDIQFLVLPAGEAHVVLIGYGESNLPIDHRSVMHIDYLNCKIESSVVYSARHGGDTPQITAHDRSIYALARANIFTLNNMPNQQSMLILNRLEDIPGCADDRLPFCFIGLGMRTFWAGLDMRMTSAKIMQKTGGLVLRLQSASSADYHYTAGLPFEDLHHLPIWGFPEDKTSLPEGYAIPFSRELLRIRKLDCVALLDQEKLPVEDAKDLEAWRSHPLRSGLLPSSIAAQDPSYVTHLRIVKEAGLLDLRQALTISERRRRAEILHHFNGAK